MYRILYGSEALHDPRDPGRALADARAELAVNEAGSLSFTVQPGHPLRDALQPMDREREVVLEQDGEELFRGRILRMAEGFRGELSVECEGELAYLNDVALRPYSTGEAGVPNAVDSLFAWYVGQYNERVEERLRFSVGINQGAELDANNYVRRESGQRQSVAQEIKEKLLEKLGGYVRVRRVGGLRAIDYLASGDRASSQRIEFGSNLMDFTRERDWADCYTAIVPVGAAPETEDGGEAEKIDISGEPDGDISGGLYKQGDRIVDLEAARRHGCIERVVEFEDVTVPANLVEAAARELRNAQVGDSLEVTAVDLHLLDPSLAPIRVGDFVRATSRPHGFDEWFVCSKLAIDVSDPGNNTFTLGSEYEYMTGRQSARLAALNASVSRAVEEAASIGEEAKAAAQEAKEAADAAVADAYEEYAVTSSRTAKPGEAATWSREAPATATGEFAWRRAVTEYGDGTAVRGEAVLLTGESAAAVEISSTNGTVIRNSRGSTTLRAAVLYGGERIADAQALAAYFGEGAHLQWSECDEGTHVAVPSDSPRLSEGGFALTVGAADITGDASYVCALVTAS